MQRVARIIAISLFIAVSAIAADPPHDYWADLMAGNDAYFHGVLEYRDLVKQREDNRDHQDPKVTILSCSDSRVPGEATGLTNDWAYRIIKQVGNYGEVFEKNVGQGSPLKIARGINALWTKGGLQYAPPVR